VAVPRPTFFVRVPRATHRYNVSKTQQLNAAFNIILTSVIIFCLVSTGPNRWDPGLWRPIVHCNIVHTSLCCRA
jgi:hypothetical protein